LISFSHLTHPSFRRLRNKGIPFNEIFMKLQLNFLGIILLVLCISCKKDQADSLSPWYPETNTNGDSIMGEFGSRIPCADCERLKFSLVIYEDAQTKLPTTYMMARVYVGRDENRIINSGNMRIIRGTALDPSHLVYELTSGAPGEFTLFWKVDENILFILDPNRQPKVGDAGYGYALNRIR